MIVVCVCVCTEMSCLMEALQDKRVRLQPECKKRLQDRIDMWSFAAKVNQCNFPPGSVVLIIQSVVWSFPLFLCLEVLFARRLYQNVKQADYVKKNTVTLDRFY